VDNKRLCEVSLELEELWHLAEVEMTRRRRRWSFTWRSVMMLCCVVRNVTQ
jgi:hypothetical protein